MIQHWLVLGQTRPRVRRVPRRFAPALAGLAVLGAVLAWGPVGLGNGPLYAGLGRGVVISATDRSGVPVALTSPAVVGAGLPARIDGIAFLPAGGYPAPRIFAALAVSDADCDGAGWLTRLDKHAFIEHGCRRKTFGALAGTPFAAGASSGAGAIAAEAWPPPPRGCWAIRDVVVHYHVGIRHYAATDPLQVAICGARASQARLTAAKDAAGGMPG
jgi:hypothetical protein